MAKREYEEQQLKMAREEWFKDHKAKREIAMRIECIEWSKEHSSLYSVHYLKAKNILSVSGDLGAAVYVWSELLTWDFLSKCDLHYFVGKCVASEAGRKFESWEPRIVDEWLNNYAKENGKTFFGWDHSCQQEWMEFLRHNQGAFGPQWYEYGDVGSVIHPRAIGHWQGLQMACKQIQDEAK